MFNGRLDSIFHLNKRQQFGQIINQIWFPNIFLFDGVNKTIILDTFVGCFLP